MICGIRMSFVQNMLFRQIYFDIFLYLPPFLISWTRQIVKSDYYTEIIDCFFLISFDYLQRENVQLNTNLMNLLCWRWTLNKSFHFTFAFIFILYLTMCKVTNFTTCIGYCYHLCLFSWLYLSLLFGCMYHATWNQKTKLLTNWIENAFFAL